MILYIIPAITILVSLSVIIFILVKKLPQLSSINIESIAEEKESKVRNRIITERLLRNLIAARKISAEILRPIVKDLTRIGQTFYQRIIELEKAGLQKTQPLKQIDQSQEIKEKLAEADKMLAGGDFVKVEEIAISVLELDKKNFEAYELLAGVYREKKEYKKARQTCRYLIRLLNKEEDEAKAESQKHLLANCHADLGAVYQEEGKSSQALSSFEKAVELEPNNPRFLDLLLKVCIILKDKNLAKQVFTELKKADPENQKLAELKDEIDGLPDK